MSAHAWSALADRFAVLAAEQDFEFRTYPFNASGAFQDDDNRIRLAYPFEGTQSAPECTAVVIATGPTERREFAHLNRLRWLSWAAGWLLQADPLLPAELHWWRHVRGRHPARIRTHPEPRRTTLPDLVQASAEVAHHFAVNGAPPPAKATTPKRDDNWHAVQAAFGVLRERFNSPSWHTAKLDAGLASFEEYACWNMWRERDVEPAIISRSSGNAPWGQNGPVWGVKGAVDAFVVLATDAGNALPAELSFTPPLFPTLRAIPNPLRSGVAQWLEFLFIVYPTSFRIESDWPMPGSRIARLTSSPFFVSTTAIDRFLAADGSAFLLAFREEAARSNPWFGDEDRAAAVAAIKAASDRKTAFTTRKNTRAAHWTEFPERVESFGDLLSVLETLDRDVTDDVFMGNSFRNSRESAAYTVIPTPAGYHFQPRFHGMPGLERLFDLLDMDGGPLLTLAQVKELRGRAAKAINRGRPEVNALTFQEMVEALSPQSPPLPGPPPIVDKPIPCAIRTFGELLANLWCVEEAVAATQAEADAMNGAIGSGKRRIKAAYYEADAEYKKHPAFPLLEAHVNRLYGPFTHAHLLRVRGELCFNRNCTGLDADKLTFKEVIAELGWHEFENAQSSRNGANVSEDATAPARQNSAGQQPVNYTMGDIRDLLRYKREYADFEALRRSTFKPTLSLPGSIARAHWAAYNCPQPGRLGEEAANALGTYRRLLRESLRVLQRKLDEQTLLYFVGEVADHHKRQVDELWSLLVDDFGLLMDEQEKPDGPDQPSVETAPTAYRTETQEPATTGQEHKLNERQKLILTEMLDMGVVGNTKKTTRKMVAQRVDKKKTGADLGRPFGVLKNAGYTDSDVGPDGGVWLTGKGKVRAEELNTENGQ